MIGLGVAGAHLRAFAGERKVAVGVAKAMGVFESVKEAVKLAGGLGFIKEGGKVLIKPNINTGDPPPACTNPEVLLATIKLVRERGAEVIVGDKSMYMLDTLKQMKKSGILDAIKEGGAKPLVFEKWRRVKPGSAGRWKGGFRIVDLEVDHIISIPVLKTHSLAWFSMALKNVVGAVPAKERIKMHIWDRINYKKFVEMFVEFNLTFKPDLIIMDATRGFVSGGPSEGDVIEPGLIVATKDIIANDLVGLALLKSFGTEDRIQKIPPSEQHQIKHAVSLGLGIKKASEIELKVKGISIKTIEKYLA